MRISILTAFPDFLNLFKSVSKNIEKIIINKIISVDVVNIRDFGRVDDKNCGGTGMVYVCSTLEKAIQYIKKDNDTFVINFSPRGQKLTQDLIKDISKKDNLTFICSRYEGVDERFINKNVDLEISLGDYVISNGEISAIVALDAICRMIGSVKDSSLYLESFDNNRIDSPCFALPREVDNTKVPDVLLKGNHKDIELWRRKYSILSTLLFAPEIIKKTTINSQDLILLKEIRKLIDKLLR